MSRLCWFQSTQRAMRQVKVHHEKSIRFTQNAASLCASLSHYKRKNPDATFKQMAQHFGLTEVNTRRYYYGVHHRNSSDSYTQMRKGASVPIW